ncbi:hypothetical protein N7526_001956 [Penicillium atrosanguineum]|nr:hypothetical protein N7526_001956 [Penicillium atrosanguineum]
MHQLKWAWSPNPSMDASVMDTAGINMNYCKTPVFATRGRSSSQMNSLRNSRPRADRNEALRKPMGPCRGLWKRWIFC